MKWQGRRAHAEPQSGPTLQADAGTTAAVQLFLESLPDELDGAVRSEASLLVRGLAGIGQLAGYASARDFGLGQAGMLLIGTVADDSTELSLLRSIKDDTQSLRREPYETALHCLATMARRSDDALRAQDLEMAHAELVRARALAGDAVQRSLVAARLAQCEMLRGDIRQCEIYLREATEHALAANNEAKQDELRIGGVASLDPTTLINRLQELKLNRRWSTKLLMARAIYEGPGSL